jgi:hypothetical protein
MEPVGALITVYVDPVSEAKPQRRLIASRRKRSFDEAAAQGKLQHATSTVESTGSARTFLLVPLEKLSMA